MVRGGDQSVSDKDAMSSQLVLIDHRLETGVEQGRGASPVTSVQTRSSKRKRARTEVHTSNKMADSLPRYFYLCGTEVRHRLNRKHHKTGLWRINRKINEFSFAVPTDASYAEDIIQDPSSKS
jgi:hypothetical protein